MFSSRSYVSSILISLVLTAAPSLAQVGTIVIPAGTPEDQAIQAITNEQDAQKRTAMLKDMAEKFASNPNAVAYAYSQLASMELATGNAAQALADGDKALAAMPNNLEILMAQVNAAQALKDSDKAFEYAARGGAAFNGIGKSGKPDGMSDEDFAGQSDSMRNSVRPNYEYLETTAYNIIAGENNAQKRLGYAQRFAEAFPNSRFEEPVTQLALVSLQETGDSAKLFQYGDKLLASNPNSYTTLTLLANAYAETKNADLAKAIGYAKKAIELANPEDPSADDKRKRSAGLAYGALGYSLMKEGKTAAGAEELKKGSSLLGDDPVAQSVILFRLGNAYAMLKEYEQARDVLTKAAAIKGPYQQASKELLAKVKSR